MKKLLTMILVAFVMTINAAGADFYVSPQGSDRNPGTKAKPFASVARAQQAVRKVLKGDKRADVTVFLRGGLYELEETIVFGLKDSAARGHTVTYAAYPGEEPIFSSGKEITGWEKLKKAPSALPAVARDKVWVTDLPEAKGDKWRFRTLFDGEEMLPRARSKGFNPTEKGVLREKRWEVLDTLHFPEGTIRNWDNLEDVEILIRPNHQWLVNYLPLASVDEKNNIAKTAIPGTYRLSAVKNQDWPETCWVENVLEVLDEPGEWVLDTRRGKLYLWPRGNKPGDNIVAPRFRELVKVEGKNVEALTGDVPVRGIVFKGLTFTRGDRDVWTKDDKGIQHDWDMYDKDNALLRFRGAVDCVVEDCTFRNSGGSGVRLDLYCQNIRLTGNHLFNIGGTAVLFCGYGPGIKDVNKGHLAQNNHIHHIGTLHRHGPAFFIWQSGDNKILNNYIHDIPYDGIVLSGVRPRYFDITDPVKWTITGLIPKDVRENMLTIRWDEVGHPTTARQTQRFAHSRNNLVQDNELHNTVEVLGDGNAIYLSCAGTGNQIRRNLTYRSPGAGGEIRFDDDQQDCVVKDNIVFGDGITLKHRNRIDNNIIVGYAPRVVIKNETEVGASVEKNIFYKLEGGAFYLSDRPLTKDFEALKRGAPDYNFYYSEDLDGQWEMIKQLQENGLERHSRVGDPMFVDLENGDVRLKPDSPARKLGIRSIDITKIGMQDDPAWLRLKKMGFETFYGPRGEVHAE